jgi:lysophospholipase L1-like esterase
VRAFHPNVSLVYLAGAFLYGFSVKGEWHTACHPDWDARYESVLLKQLGDLRREPGAVFVASIPYPVGPYDGEPDKRERVDCINRIIRKSVPAVPGVQLLDVANRLCPQGVCQQDIGLAEPIRPDGVHFSIEAAHELSRWVYEQMKR